MISCRTYTFIPLFRFFSYYRAFSAIIDRSKAKKMKHTLTFACWHFACTPQDEARKQVASQPTNQARPPSIEFIMVEKQGRFISEAGRSSRTPSPVSSAAFRSAGQDHVVSRQHHQHQHHRLHPVASRLPVSPDRNGAGTRAWIPPVIDDGRVAAVSCVGGEAHGGGEWDEEAQARASGSVGKQILQRYLTHLYPKVCISFIYTCAFSCPCACVRRVSACVFVF